MRKILLKNGGNEILIGRKIHNSNQKYCEVKNVPSELDGSQLDE